MCPGYATEAELASQMLVGCHSLYVASRPPLLLKPIISSTDFSPSSRFTQPAATHVVFQARVYARSELLHVAAVRVAQQRSGSPPSKPHGRGKDVVSTIAGVDPNHVGADRQALGQSGTPPTGMMYSGGETGRSPLSTGVSESNASLEKDSPPPRHAFMGGGNGKRGIWRAAEGGARQREFSFGWDGGEVVVGGGGKGEGYYQAPVAVTSQPVRRAEDKILDRSGGIEEARGGPAPPPSHEVLAWLR